MRVSVRFDLAGMDRWRIAIADGQVTAGPSDETADCVVETNGETLQAILDGEQNVRTAYISGKSRCTGTSTWHAG
jgi:putative sterol carrier protein